MLPPPAPRAEIVVTVGSDSRGIIVYCASPDAMQWALRAAEAYGTTLPFTDGRMFIVHVMPNYDAAEVAAYLRSYNEEEN